MRASGNFTWIADLAQLTFSTHPGAIATFFPDTQFPVSTTR